MTPAALAFVSLPCICGLCFAIQRFAPAISMSGSFSFLESAFEPLRKALLPHVLAGRSTITSLQAAVGIPAPGKQDDKPWSTLALVHYWICQLATKLGDEIWFITFLPWSHWGFNQAVGRNMIPGWAISLYIGQALKDTIQLPRPDGVASFTGRYAGEYGLPSTHTSNSIVLAGSLIFDAYNNTATPSDFWWIAGPSIAWIILCPYSRVALGAHYPLDIVAGAIFGVIMLALKQLYLDPALETFLLRGDPIIAAFVMLACTVLAVALIPCPKHPAHITTPGDTTTVLGVMLGCSFGYIIRRQEQLAAFDEPLTAVSGYELLLSVPLTLLGFGIAIGTKEAVKLVVRPTLVLLMGPRDGPVEAEAEAEAEGDGVTLVDGESKEEAGNTGESGNKGGRGGRRGSRSAVAGQKQLLRPLPPGERYEIELPQKLITYSAVGFASVVVAPLAFRYLGLQGRY